MPELTYAKRWRPQAAGLTFVAPAAIFLAITMGYPCLYVIYHSFFAENFANPDIGSTFVGFANYAQLLNESRFWNSLIVTAIFVVVAVGLQLVVGMAIALVFQRVLAGRRLLVSLLLLPAMMMPVAVGLMWKYMLDDTFGMVSYYLSILHVLGPEGLYPHPVLGGATSALFAVIAADVWEWTPFMALILLAGLESLPVEPFEAAAVDGASRLQEFVYLTLPMLRSAVTVALLIRFIDAMRVLDVILVMTNGGPGRSTETAQYYSYQLGFQTFDTGLAFAQIILVMIAVVVGCGLIFRAILPKRAEA